MSLTIYPGKFTLSELRAIYEHQPALTLNPDCLDQIEQSNRVIGDIIDNHRTVYGVNTGFGLLARTSIPQKDLASLQRNLLLSHSTGTGNLLDDGAVALIMALKAGSLARGFSGVRMAVIDSLLALYNANVYPCIPEKGSVGASGDLSPLAHMSCVLIGVGEVRYQGRSCLPKRVWPLLGCNRWNSGPRKDWH